VYISSAKLMLSLVWALIALPTFCAKTGDAQQNMAT
jgi:hypothetical protein